MLKRWRFNRALQEVFEMKGIPRNASQITEGGKLLSDSILDKLEVPFWCNLTKWILENWKTILQLIVILV